LLDAKPPKGADRPGGHGRIFDWALLRGFVPPVPYLLSGGLTPDNVGEAVRITGTQGVDVSSGVETAPGIKSPDLIRTFIANARAAVGNRIKEKAAS
jgi:phosphoribosylanthranilate isomerase